MSVHGDNVQSPVRILTVEQAAREIIDLAEPLIIRGGCERATTKWNETWLISLMGQTPCRISLDSRTGKEQHKTTCLMAEYLEKQRSRGEPAADGRNVEYLFHTLRDTSRISEILEDIDLPPGILQFWPAVNFRIYVGPAWSGTLPHSHTYAINALARGRKRWAIYIGRDKPHNDSLRRESFSKYGSGAQAVSWFEAECPKLRSRGARLWEFIQEAGDVLFIPAYYLHAVVNTEPVVGFTADFFGSGADGTPLTRASHYQ